MRVTVRWARHVVCTERNEKCIEKLEQKKPLWRPKHKWKGNIEMGLKIGCICAD